jgi:hypothetical protein
MDGSYLFQTLKVQAFTQHDPSYLLNVEMPKDLSFLHMSPSSSIPGVGFSLHDFGKLLNWDNISPIPSRVLDLWTNIYPTTCPLKSMVEIYSAPRSFRRSSNLHL